MQLRAPRIPRPLSRSAFRCTGASQFPTMEKTPLESSRRALLVSPVAYKSLGYRFLLLLGGAQAPSMQFNASNKRRLLRSEAEKSRPVEAHRAGTNLIALLGKCHEDLDAHDEHTRHSDCIRHRSPRLNSSQIE